MTATYDSHILLVSRPIMGCRNKYSNKQNRSAARAIGGGAGFVIIFEFPEIVYPSSNWAGISSVCMAKAA